MAVLLSFHFDRESIAWVGGLLFCIGNPDGGQGSRRALYNRICWSVQNTSQHWLSRARWMSPRRRSETLTTVVFSFAFFSPRSTHFYLGWEHTAAWEGEGLIPGVLETRDVGNGKETYEDSTVSILRISRFLGSVFFFFPFLSSIVSFPLIFLFCGFLPFLYSPLASTFPSLFFFWFRPSTFSVA